MESKRCNFCNNMFKPRDSRHIYCSPLCSRWCYYHDEPYCRVYIKACPECNSTFLTRFTTKQFCAEKCMWRVKTRRNLTKNPNKTDRRLYYKQWRARMELEGRCVRCGGDIPVEAGGRMCANCVMTSNERYGPGLGIRSPRRAP